ncbi:MAG: choice-of-anchor V domain-containing protein [Bacteroidia bacterium]|nr:hypothetical protein [Bacteroidia bacterium]MDW8334370.1 choice-of-anchor V domain-containing protein [Bacteroidia bacterium]
MTATALLTIHGVQFSSQPPVATSGAPGEGNCSGCHTGNPVNGGAGGVQISLADASGNPVTQYAPGQTHLVTVRATHPMFSRFGFQATALLADNTAAGNFPAPGSGMSVQTSGGRQYVGHTSSGVFTPLMGEKTWVFNWEAPPTDAGTITFYVAANAVNGNGTTSGDFVYTASRSFSALVPPPTIVVSPSNEDRRSAGRTVSVAFTVAGGSFAADNVFTAELSNAMGDFANATTLGSEPGTGSGSIVGVVPVNIASGAGYKIRVRASSPAATSEPSAQNYRGVPLPVINWPTSLNLCVGAVLNLPAPNLPGAQYIWTRNGQLLPETGHTLAVSAPGNYSLSLTDECGSTVEASVVVVGVEPQIPVVTRTGNTLSSSPAQTYQWYFNGTAVVGANQADYSPTQDGTYTVEVVDSNGCTAVSAPFEFVFDPGAPTLSLQYSGGNVCAGTNITVEISTSGTFGANNVFRLELSDTTGNFAAPTLLGTQTIAGTFNVVLPKTLPAGGGYRMRALATDPATISPPTEPFAVFAAAPEVQIVMDGNALTVVPQPTGATLTWKLDGSPYNGPLDGSQPDGTYVAVTTTPNGCVFESEPYVYVAGSRLEAAASNLVVFPHPVSQKAQIALGSRAGWKAVLFNLEGKAVPARITDDGTLDATELPAGLYELKIVLDGREYRRKIVVQR